MKLNDVSKIPRMLIMTFPYYRLQRQKTLDSGPPQDMFRECKSTFAHYSPLGCIKKGYKFMRCCEKLVDNMNLQKEFLEYWITLFSPKIETFSPNQAKSVYMSQEATLLRMPLYAAGYGE